VVVEETESGGLESLEEVVIEGAGSVEVQVVVLLEVGDDQDVDVVDHQEVVKQSSLVVLVAVV
jgi:hypothetical protein